MISAGVRTGVNCIAHEVTIVREVLEMSKKPLENSKKFLEIAIPRRPGEKRDAWFWRAGNALGIAASRLKSLYYDPRCKMWAQELDKIERKQRELLHQELADLRVRQDVLEERLALPGEYHEDELEEGREGGFASSCAPAPDLRKGVHGLR